ncbi:hypothetical protein BKK79_36735 (plasmid) [Cupriavidus sp. USMAA2-4]|uniref:hypothetical protein n=1 Tax=Cupriavidus sp. USMAA2-4 TaxID=876364 RepID=UPI0008A6D594|nr:hypothetical protein [Cupriavidus sp. USMAA2-4]AOY97497.1 hypothetical protein BKK79_36735 [Cupriavidus sp. USMAA2-4]
MILTVNNRPVAFGLDWRVLLSRGKPDGLARKSKAALLWADPNGQYAGLLPPAEVPPKRGGPVFAGGQLVARATSEPNVAYVAEMPGNEHHYLVCCIHQRRPRRDFDQVDRSASQVSDLLAEFATLCGEQGYVLYGDAHLEHLRMLTLQDLVRYADPQAAMRRPAASLKLTHVAAAVVVVGGSVLGYQAYRDWQTKRAADEAARNTLSAEELYTQALAAAASKPVLLARDLGPYLDWVRGLPVSVGGWGLKGGECKPVGPDRLQCDVRLERNFAAATNATFLAAAPEAWRSTATFAPDQKTVYASESVVLAGWTTVANVLKAALPRADVPGQFLPILQTLAIVGTEPKLDALSPFALPPGVAEGDLKTIYREGKWTVQMPLRTVPKLTNFPTYASIRSIGIAVDRSPKATSAESFAIVTVTGSILTR